MIINGQTLFEAAPIKDMLYYKERLHGVSHGLTEAGYDIRLKQDIKFYPQDLNDTDLTNSDEIYVEEPNGEFGWTPGRFTIASAIEEFQMPEDLVGVVHDKSTWARKGLSVFNTVIEPGWFGELTLELVYHGQEPLHLPAGCGIAQVLFSRVDQPTAYAGKYQGQSGGPTPARFE